MCDSPARHLCEVVFEDIVRFQYEWHGADEHYDPKCDDDLGVLFDEIR